jgi:hypothetical protein
VDHPERVRPCAEGGAPGAVGVGPRAAGWWGRLWFGAASGGERLPPEVGLRTRCALRPGSAFPKPLPFSPRPSVVQVGKKAEARWPRVHLQYPRTLKSWLKDWTCTKLTTYCSELLELPRTPTTTVFYIIKCFFAFVSAEFLRRFLRGFCGVSAGVSALVSARPVLKRNYNFVCMHSNCLERCAGVSVGVSAEFLRSFCGVSAEVSAEVSARPVFKRNQQQTFIGSPISLFLRRLIG